MTLQQSISGYVLKDYKQTVLISSSTNCYAQLNLFPRQLVLFYFLNTEVITSSLHPSPSENGEDRFLSVIWDMGGGGRDEGKEIEVRSRSCPCFPLAER